MQNLYYKILHLWSTFGMVSARRKISRYHNENGCRQHKCKICNTNFASDEEVKEHILIHRECCPFPACSKVTHCHHRDGMYAFKCIFIFHSVSYCLFIHHALHVNVSCNCPAYCVLIFS